MDDEGDRGGRSARDGHEITVLLVDDHRLMVEMTQVVLAEAGYRVVGSAYRLSEVPALLVGERADVALVDYTLPDGRGSEAIRLIQHAWPGCRSVLLTGHADREIAEEAIAAGADGVMLKDRSLDELVQIVRRAAAGDVLLDASILASLIERTSSGPIRPLVNPLTDRERDALEVLLAVGDTEEAARRLGITESTYRVHLHHAMKKLGVEGRLEAISVALRAGIIRPPSPSGRQTVRD
ncbi:MAG: response regulator transcription factor [Chloroflexota bacterium]